jgi:hypothetical protein
VAKSPARVVSAYTAASAPVPPGSTVTAESEALLRVESPLRVSGILVSERPGGSVYTIAGSPTLQITGGGLVPDFADFVPVGAALMDVTGLGFMAVATLDRSPWVVSVFPKDRAAAMSADQPGPMQLALMPGPLQSTTEDVPLPKGTLKGRCDVRSEAGFIVATATISRKTITVRACLTDALAALMPPPSATLVVSKKWGRARSRPRLTGSGFDPRERISLTLGDRKAPGTTADAAGDFSKTLQVPPDMPTGPAELTATGTRSKRTAKAPYEVRPPR